MEDGKVETTSDVLPMLLLFATFGWAKQCQLTDGPPKKPDSLAAFRSASSCSSRSIFLNSSSRLAALYTTRKRTTFAQVEVSLPPVIALDWPLPI